MLKRITAVIAGAFLAAALTPGAAAARQTSWTVVPGGTFAGTGTINIDRTECHAQIQGDFFDGSGVGAIRTVRVLSCFTRSGLLLYPQFQVPIGMTATRYFDFIDTTTGMLDGVVIRLSGRCSGTIGGPAGPGTPARLEVLYQNESHTMWWSSGVGTTKLWNASGCEGVPSDLAIRGKFAVTPSHTIRPSA